MTRSVKAFVALLLAALAAPAAAQVVECQYPEGSFLYTDKACATLGATKVPEHPQPRLAIRYRNACARDLQELMYQLSTAIEVGDVNQLAEYYQWTGLSTRTGYDIMDRLEKIAGRPLIDILPVYPRDPEPAPGAPLYVPPVSAHHPVALRIEQTLEDGTTPSRTTLALEKNIGCWWVHL